MSTVSCCVVSHDWVWQLFDVSDVDSCEFPVHPLIDHLYSNHPLSTHHFRCVVQWFEAIAASSLQSTVEAAWWLSSCEALHYPRPIRSTFTYLQLSPSVVFFKLNRHSVSNCMLSCICMTACHAYAWQRDMYLLKIGFSRITPVNVNGSR